MTDFFGDLEREIRAAHPRRPKPIVPVRLVAVTAAVATTIAVLVLAVGALSPSAEREVAQPPSPPAPAGGECGAIPKASDPLPDELLRNFAVLRSGVSPGALDLEVGDRELPDDVLAIYERGIRVHASPGGADAIAIVPVSLPCGEGRGAPGLCILPFDRGTASCGGGSGELDGDFLLMSVGNPRDDDGKRKVTILANDASFDRVEVTPDGPLQRLREQNLILAERVAEDKDDLKIRLGEEAKGILPIDCATTAEMGALKKRLAIFREPPAKDLTPFDAALPKGFHRIFMTEARVVGDYVVFPAGDATCATGVCIAKRGAEKAECTLDLDRPVMLTLTTERGDGLFDVAALVADGARDAEIRSPQESLLVDPRENLVVGRVRSDAPGGIEVTVGS